MLTPKMIVLFVEWAKWDFDLIPIFCYCLVLLSLAIARTGKVPTPLNFGGMALKVKPSVGNTYKLHKCSTIRISAPKSVV
ncbi:hypothetical protein BH11BAC5_BH11BAC5_22550 [soil metagenome]